MKKNLFSVNTVTDKVRDGRYDMNQTNCEIE